jgi:exopolysaccharide biosynthesis polyprenyl glycosylphosphotransferase
MDPLHSRRTAALIALQGVDLLIGGAAFGAAVGVDAYIHVERAGLLATNAWQLAWAALGFMLAWHLILASRGLYDSRRVAAVSREVVEIVVAGGLATGLLVLGLVLLDSRVAERSFTLLFFSLLVGASLASRLAMRALLRTLRVRGRNLRFVLVVGTGRRAAQLVRSIENAPELGYRVVGFVDDVDLGAAGPRMLGRIADLPAVLSAHVIDELFVALPIRSRYADTEWVAREAEKQGVPVMLLPDLFSMRLARTRVGEVGESPVVRFSTGPEHDGRMIAKRLLDVALGAVALAAFAPVMLAIAVAIRCDSPGPVLFRQTRIGLNKRPFTLYKFRTMVADAERRQRELEARNECDGAAFKIRDDPRVTRLGAFLRRTSLDELPQLFNVLKGEMSLVGPRPLPMRDVERFREDWQRRRFSVPPGLTCLWQTSGRSDLSFERWMELDLEYIDRWSLRLDLEILLRTVRAVLRREGAY